MHFGRPPSSLTFTVCHDQRIQPKPYRYVCSPTQVLFLTDANSASPTTRGIFREITPSSSSSSPSTPCTSPPPPTSHSTLTQTQHHQPAPPHLARLSLWRVRPDKPLRCVRCLLRARKTHSPRRLGTRDVRLAENALHGSICDRASPALALLARHDLFLARRSVVLSYPRTRRAHGARRRERIRDRSRHGLDRPFHVQNTPYYLF